jgi:hypothetical protein
MQFDEMNCTILKPYGRLSFQLPPTSPSKCLMQPTNLSNSRANSDCFDLLDAADNFKILVHEHTQTSG